MRRNSSSVIRACQVLLVLVGFFVGEFGTAKSYRAAADEQPSLGNADGVGSPQVAVKGTECDSPLTLSRAKKLPVKTRECSIVGWSPVPVKRWGVELFNDSVSRGPHLSLVTQHVRLQI